MFGSSSGAACTFSRLKPIVTKPSLALSTASMGIRKGLSPIPRCPPTVTCRKRTCQSSSSIEEVPHAADPVVVGVRDGAVGQVARHEEDVRPRARFFHREPPRYARFYAPHLFPRGRGAILAGADLTTMCIRVMCAEANLHTPFTQIKAVASTESYGLLPAVFVGAG